MTYWQKRQQQLNNQLEKDEEKLKFKLSKSYDIQQKKLEKEIAGYYQAYGENNVIEYRKLMESLSYEDKQLLLQRMDEFAEKYPQYAHLMPVRESIYKLNRLEGLQTNIKMQQLEIGAIDNTELQSHLEQLALRSANSSAEQLGFGKNFYTINSDLVAKIVNKQWADGKNFSERIWNNRSKLADYLNNDFAMAIARGDSYQRCIKALGERFEKVSRHDIYRLIYTEGTFVQNEASITPFEKDFEEYEISIADYRACSICKAMSGKKFSIKDRQAGINFPPFHSWCRCSFTIAVDDWDKWMDDYVEKHGKEPENSVKSVANSGGSGIIKAGNVNYAKVSDIFNFKDVPTNANITPEMIFEDLQTSKTGKKTLDFIENLPERPTFDYVSMPNGIRAEENNGIITIYVRNCKDVKTAVCSLIHECSHRMYGIGQSQWAECVCVSQELLHRRQREYLTIDELRTVIEAVKSVYPEYNWRKGGIINGRRKSR